MATETWPMPFIGVHANLDSWKQFANLLHETLLANGWVQVPTSGELIIDDVALLPTPGTFIGFINYHYVDAYDSLTQIFMQLDYGYGKTSWSTNSGPCHLKIRCRVSDNLTFAETRTFLSYNPTGQLYSGNATNAVFKTGQTFICKEDNLGFFGFVFGAESLPSGTADGNHDYASFAIFIQRNLDQDMNVIPGFSVFGGNDYSATSSVAPSVNVSWMMRYIADDYWHNTNQTTHGVRPFGESQTSLPTGIFQIAPVYTQTPEVKQVPTLFTYVSNQLSQGTQFEVETPFGTFNYIALGEGTHIWQATTLVPSPVHARIGILWQ